MKAVSLPVNVLVIIVIALMVLMVIVSFYFGMWNPTKLTVTQDLATKNACQIINPSYCTLAYRSARVPVYNFDANKNGNINDFATSPASCGDSPTGIVCFGQDNFEELCNHYYGGPPNLGAGVGDPNWKSFVTTCMVGICKCPEYPQGSYTE